MINAETDTLVLKVTPRKLVAADGVKLVLKMLESESRMLTLIGVFVKKPSKSVAKKLPPMAETFGLKLVKTSPYSGQNTVIQRLIPPPLVRPYSWLFGKPGILGPLVSVVAVKLKPLPLKLVGVVTKFAPGIPLKVSV